MIDDESLARRLEKTGIVELCILERAIEKTGKAKKVAKEYAEMLVDLFGYYDRILDNVLRPTKRDIFYMLETDEILKTEREEAKLYDGKDWRINYWVYNTKRICELIKSQPKTIEGAAQDIYKDENMWSHAEDAKLTTVLT